MKCARLRLQERTKVTNKIVNSFSPDKPRRYCQKRMVNPDHEEDPRWIDVLQRFHCNVSENMNETPNSMQPHQRFEDLFLSVQNLKFQGNEQQRKRPRTGFKYKTLTDGKQHRMFVKQVVHDSEQCDEDRSSQLTCYYFDDYANYLLNDRSRPSSGKSVIFLQGLKTKVKENKATQVDIGKTITMKKLRNTESKQRNNHEIIVNQSCEQNKNDISEQSDAPMQDTKIAFHKSGKRQSLTISRVPSPETVQVIRVDVVCTHSSSSTLSDSEEKKQTRTDNKVEETSRKKIEESVNHISVKNSHFANKYLLTNTVKTLEERISGGAKVTLFCKTFKLSARSKMLTNKKTNGLIKK